MALLRLKDLPERPADSCLEIENTQEGLVLRWLNPRGGAGRRGLALFLLVPLAVIAPLAVAAGIDVCRTLSRGTAILYPRVALFLFCVSVSSFLAYCIVVLCMSRRSEVLTLRQDALVYRRGTPPVGQRRGNLIWGTHDISWEPFGPRRRLQATRGSVTNVKLVRLAGRQRLSIDRGAERVEIGRYLPEPDREWLAEVLRLWLAEG